MFYYIKVYTRYIIFLSLLFLVSLIFYEISKIKSDVTFTFYDYTIYTKANVLISILMLSVFLLFKIFGIVLSINSWFISFRYNFFEKLEAAKSFFNFRQKTSGIIMKDILAFKRRKMYKAALRMTSENYLLSDKFLFWHLFFLLKLGRRREFFRMFKAKPCGRAIKLFLQIYLKNKFKITKRWLIRKYYLENPDNQVFNYIYAKTLFERGAFKKSKIILMNFLYNKQILMTDFYCSYLMNLLAIKIERSLNGEAANDFILDYQENIDKYYESKKQ